MKMTQDELAKVVYTYACGETDQPLPPELEGLEITDAYADGATCDLLYWEFWDAREQYCKKLGIPQDTDLDEIAEIIFQIGKELSLQMFRYGMEAQRLGLIGDAAQ